MAEGELSEEQFDPQLNVAKTTVLGPGQIADRDLEGSIIHRVANRGSQPLVSLHLYGVSADKLTTGINRYF